MIEACDITALILAGGLGRRMSADGKGSEKGLIVFKNQPMVHWVAQRLAPQVGGGLILNCNSNTSAYRELMPEGTLFVSDQVSGFAGPLAGVEAALSICPTPWLVTAPCDSPFLPIDLVSRFAEQAALALCDVVVARDAKHPQPVFMMLKTSLLANLRQYLNGGDRKIDRWYERLNHCYVEFLAPSVFANVNTPDELNALAQLRL